MTSISRKVFILFVRKTNTNTQCTHTYSIRRQVHTYTIAHTYIHWKKVHTYTIAHTYIESIICLSLVFPVDVYLLFTLEATPMGILLNFQCRTEMKFIQTKDNSKFALT